MENVQGLDLKIDNAIQKTCEASNATSSSSRGVLYVIVLVAILSMIAVLNTHKIFEKKLLMNWTELRLKRYKDDIHLYKDSLHKADSLKTADTSRFQDALWETEKLREFRLRNKLENIQTVRIPVLGNAFDINDLGFVVGVTFCILLFMLRFTVLREFNNLRIALHAISERYVAHANWKDFEDILETIPPEKRDHYLSCINYTRRQHHYNFLSMNEIYTLPPLQNDTYKIRWFSRFIIRNIFWLPCVVYIFIIANDFSTEPLGASFSELATQILIGQEILLLLLLIWFCKKCTALKKSVDKLYNDFKVNHYIFKKTPEEKKVE